VTGGFVSYRVLIMTEVSSIGPHWVGASHSNTWERKKAPKLRS
jgi:hypothetical protein